MEEIVFNALQENRKFEKVENFIMSIVHSSNDASITYDAVKESIIKLVLYRFIKVHHATDNCISKESNFFQAEELGGVKRWLAEKRSLCEA
jgi:hypothetical protein